MSQPLSALWPEAAARFIGYTGGGPNQSDEFIYAPRTSPHIRRSRDALTFPKVSSLEAQAYCAGRGSRLATNVRDDAQARWLARASNNEHRRKFLGGTLNDVGAFSVFVGLFHRTCFRHSAQTGEADAGASTSRPVLKFDPEACVQFNTTATALFDESVAGEAIEEEERRREVVARETGSTRPALSSTARDDLKLSSLRRQYRECARRLATVDEPGSREFLDHEYLLLDPEDARDATGGDYAQAQAGGIISTNDTGRGLIRRFNQGFLAQLVAKTCPLLENYYLGWPGAESDKVLVPT